MSRVFITGSTEGLGLAAAAELMDQGHEVVLHARSAQRAATLSEAFATRSAGVVVGDLGSAAETRRIAETLNAQPRLDAVIHNAGVYPDHRSETLEGHSTVFAVNTLAPYLLTALMHRPRRLVYLSSGLHRGGESSLRDLDWRERSWSKVQAYSDSKLFVTAMTMALARRWPEVLCNAVNPGWVPTRMGGSGAPDDLQKGHETQAWLAVSDDAAAQISGGYWHHRTQQTPAAAALDTEFQDRLLTMLAKLTGVALP